MIFEFTTSKHNDDPATLQEHINRLAGRSLLTAIHDSLANHGYAPSAVDQEDWGWYTELVAEMPYLIGAIVYQDADEVVDANATFEALIQVWRTESRKLFGLINYKKKVHAPLDDPFVTTLDGIIQALNGVENVRVSSG
ncbi:hypothetical protein QTO30_06620 [Yoonia sp. GPGPB17]|uniref:hypothetical protein n=1 Tax=Yoonia sp. GPGPB17 TaxID=3026147 RepID=UPI0030C118E4